MHADTGENVWITNRSVVSDNATICLLYTKIIIGSEGYVLCLDQTSGKVIWETGLKDVNNVVLLPMPDKIIAATMGNIYALDLKQGIILWSRDLGSRYTNSSSSSLLTYNLLVVIKEFH